MRLKLRVLAIASFLFTAFIFTAPARAADTPVAEVSNLRMYSSFWQNLHHFLYASAWARRPVVAGVTRWGMPIPPGSDVTMTAAEKTAWDNALAIYDREFLSRDLLFDYGMTQIKRGLVDRDDALDGAPFDSELKALFLSTAPIYRKYWWPAHDAANRAWIEDARGRIEKYGPGIASRVAALHGNTWFSTPVRVDVVRIGRTQNGYTSNNPTHVVVASGDETNGGWASVELLFHESSHGLNRKTQLAIDAALQAAGKRAPLLWHVVLFYIAGEVTRQQLAKDGVVYKPFLYSLGLFPNVWGQYQRAVEEHVQAYVDGKTTLEQMAVNLAGAIP